MNEDSVYRGRTVDLLACCVSVSCFTWFPQMQVNVTVL